MWILARLLITLGSFVYRLVFRQIPDSFPMNHDGIPYSAKVSSSEKHSITTVETPVDSLFICALSQETAWDRFAKKIGFGDEIQVHDPEFNERIFILGDHPLTAQYLSSSAELRDRIRALIPKQALSIVITGKTLRFVLQPDYAASSVLDDLVFIRGGIEKIQYHAVSRFADPYYRKAVILESLMMAIMTYGFVSFAEMRLVHEDYHLDSYSLIRSSLAVTVAIAAAVIAMTWALLGRSSRGIRLMVENGLIMMLALPIVGFEILSDLNRGLDNSESIVVTSRLARKWKETHRRRRGTYTTYHLTLDPPQSPQPSPFRMPRSITVASELYWYVEEGERIDFEIGEGYLGFPWYRSMAPHTDGE